MDIGLPRLFFFVLLFCSASACDRCVHKSKASYFSSSSSLSAGACGYGTMVKEFNRGYIAAASSTIFREGVGCGACFQIRCTNAKICSTGGVKVVVTDLNRNNSTDFVLSSPAFLAMARSGEAQNLKSLGVINIEHKRIPCEYANKNLAIRVEESSKKPSNLVIKFLYQGGQTDIVAADVATAGDSNWRYLSRNYGAVWSTDRVPAGPLQFRMVVTGGYDGKWVWADKEVLPAEWVPGRVYDSGVQITDVAQEGCWPCDTEEWK